MRGPYVQPRPPDWYSYLLSNAYDSGDPSSIVVSASDTASGLLATLTSAGAAKVLGTTGSRMAWWTWQLTDVLGRAPVGANAGGSAWEVKTLLAELASMLQQDTRALVGIIDKSDPTAAGVNGFGGGLAWPSGGNERQPACWVLNNGVFLDHNPSSGNDSVAGILEAGKRKQRQREFSFSGIRSDGTASNDLAYNTGTNIDMAPGDDGLFAVFAVGADAAVAAQDVEVCPWWLAYDAPASGYAPSRG